MNSRFPILRAPSPQHRQPVTGDDCVHRHNGQLFLQHLRGEHSAGFFLLALAALLLVTPALHAQNSHRANLVRAQSQFFFAPDSPSLSITGDLTIEAWVQDQTSFVNSEVRAVVTKLEVTGSGSYRSYSFKRRKDASGVKTLVVALSITGTSDTEQYLPYAFDDSGAWTHYAVVYTASLGRVDFYVNGVNVGNLTGYPNSIPDSNVSLKIGASFSGAELHDGSIDEVRIWATARTQDQIHASMFSELIGNESGLRGYWKLNNSLNDSSGNGNTLAFHDGSVKALYHFEDTSDSSGNGYHLANNGGVAFSAGRFGNGADLGSANSGKYLSTSDDLGGSLFNGSSSWSVWFNPSAQPPTNGVYEIFGMATYSGSAEREYRVEYLDVNGVKKVQWNRGNYAGTNTNLTYDVSLSTGTWHHIALVYDAASNIVSGYLDGVKVVFGPGFNDANFGGSNRKLNIGAWVTPTFFTSGRVDEFTILSRALTAPEVAYLAAQAYAPEMIAFAVNDLPFSGAPLEWCPDKDSKILWHLNGNASDSSASANNGTANGITFGTPNGRFSEGAGFNGTSSHIQMAAVPIVGNDISMSFGCWFKTTSPARQSLIEFGDINTLKDYPQLQIGAEAPGQLSFDFNGFPGVRPTAVFNDGQWHFVVAAVSGGASVRLYVDGIELGSNFTAGLRVSNTGTVYKQIGRAFAGQSYFNGAIDEVFVTSRVLSSEEIMKYQGGIVSARFGMSADGFILTNGTFPTFAELRSASATLVNQTSGDDTLCAIQSGASSQFEGLSRGVFVIASEGLPDTGIILNHAALLAYGSGKQAGFTPQDLAVTTASTASDTTITTTDGALARYGITALSRFIPYSEFITGGYNAFVLNADGRSAIALNGKTKFALRLRCDIEETAIVVAPFQNHFYNVRYQESPTPPYLLVEYHAAAIVAPPLDSDGDGMSDEWEMQYFGNLAQGPNGNPDTDGLTNIQEYYLGTNPSLPDTDGDGLSDGEEYNTWGTNPLATDSDFDGIPDKWETDNGLNPRRNDAGEDRDGDGLTNVQEFNGGTNPNVSDNAAEKAVTRFYDSIDRLVATTYSNGGWMAWRYDGNGNILKQKFATVRDADGDGLPDAWEFSYDLDTAPATGAGDLLGDPDGDGWTNVQEFLAGSSPVDAASVPSTAASVGAAWFTTPTAHIILPPANGGGIAIVTAKVWDSEGNPAQFALHWFDAVVNVWKSAMLASVDGVPFIPGRTLATSPAGILHTFRWNTVADFPGGKNGSLLIRLTVTDAAGTAISPPIPYSVNNTGDTDGDGLPDLWEVPRGLDPNDASGVSGAYGNPDGDGFVNFAEFVFGLNPLSFDPIGAPTVTAEVNPADGKTYLTLTYQRRTDAPSLIYEIQTTTDLATWTTTGADIEPVSTVPGGNNLEVVKVRIHPPLGSPGMPVKFVRLRVRLP